MHRVQGLEREGHRFLREIIHEWISKDRFLPSSVHSVTHSFLFKYFWVPQVPGTGQQKKNYVTTWSEAWRGHEGEGRGLHKLLRKASSPHLGKSGLNPVLMVRRLLGRCGGMWCRKALQAQGSHNDRQGWGRAQGTETPWVWWPQREAAAEQECNRQGLIHGELDGVLRAMAPFEGVFKSIKSIS